MLVVQETLPGYLIRQCLRSNTCTKLAPLQILAHAKLGKQQLMLGLQDGWCNDCMDYIQYVQCTAQNDQYQPTTTSSPLKPHLQSFNNSHASKASSNGDFHLNCHILSSNCSPTFNSNHRTHHHPTPTQPQPHPPPVFILN